MAAKRKEELKLTCSSYHYNIHRSNTITILHVENVNKNKIWREILISSDVK
jgi:hypothetical protein